VWLATLLLGPVPPGYYDTVDATNATTLRTTLHAVIKDHTKFPYSSASTDTWDILEMADQDPNESAHVLDVYKNLSLVKFGGGTGPYNREHTWPNSYGFTDDGPTNYPYTDCHALFISDVSYNSQRGNEPYGTCDAGCSEFTTTGGTSGAYPGLSNWREAGTWETWMGRRGDVARAQFYLDVRYEGGTHGVTGAAEPDLILTDNEALIEIHASNVAVAYHGRLASLLLWNTQDPVDDKERHRNDVVAGYQGNRNPFIDHPEWIACIFQGACSAPPPTLPSADFEEGGLGEWSLVVQ
jgi:endonuclease I